MAASLCFEGIERVENSRYTFAKQLVRTRGDETDSG